MKRNIAANQDGEKPGDNEYRARIIGSER